MLVNEWFRNGKFRKVNTPFRKDPAYKKYFMAALPLIRDSRREAEIEYHGKFGHTLGRIQHIDLMSRIDIFYSTYCVKT